MEYKAAITLVFAVLVYCGIASASWHEERNYDGRNVARTIHANDDMNDLTTEKSTWYKL